MFCCSPVVSIQVSNPCRSTDLTLVLSIPLFVLSHSAVDEHCEGLSCFAYSGLIIFIWDICLANNVPYVSEFLYLFKFSPSIVIGLPSLVFTFKTIVFLMLTLSSIFFPISLSLLVFSLVSFIRLARSPAKSRSSNHLTIIQCIPLGLSNPFFVIKSIKIKKRVGESKQPCLLNDE